MISNIIIKSNSSGITVGDLRQLLGELEDSAVPDGSFVVTSEQRGPAASMRTIRSIGAGVNKEDS